MQGKRPSAPWRFRKFAGMVFTLGFLLLVTHQSSANEKSDCYHGYALITHGKAEIVFRACRHLAELGEIRAFGALGGLYWDGFGTKQDTYEAIYWHTRAAIAGDIQSKFFLGTIYEDGAKGAPKDNVRAYMWYTLAAQGLEQFNKIRARDQPRFDEVPQIARSSLTRLVNSMTPKEVSDAKEMVAKWPDVH